MINSIQGKYHIRIGKDLGQEIRKERERKRIKMISLDIIDRNMIMEIEIKNGEVIWKEFYSIFL